MSLISWFRERQIRNLNLHGSTDYPGWDSTQRIAIYFEVLPNFEKDIEAWQKILESEGKEVELLAYQPIKRKNLDDSRQRPTICKDDRNWWSKPRGEDYSSFIQHNYEVFIDLSRGNEAVHEIVARSVNASLKVAFDPQKEAWADMLVKCEKSGLSESCRKEVLALLKFINAK